MKRILTAALVAIALVCTLAVHENPTTAQDSPPRGDTLQSKADKVRDGLLTESPDNLFAAFAPWIRGQYDLTREKVSDSLDKQIEKERAKGATDDEIAGKILKDLHRKDPADVLKLRRLGEIKSLSAAKLFALMNDVLVPRGDKDFEKHRSARWHTVNRSIFEAEEPTEFRNAKRITKTYGTVKFQNKLDDTIEVACVAEGDSWEAVGFTARICKVDLRLVDVMQDNIDASTRDARRSEGEQLLGAMKNRVKVAWAKLGELPKKLTGTMTLKDRGCGVQEEELDGRYFTVRDTVLHGDNVKFALIVEPLGGYERDGYAMLTDDINDPGSATITWYEAADELDNAIKRYEK